MTDADTALKRARSLRWGFPALFLIAGYLVAKPAFEYGDYLQIADGLALLAVGGGMYFSLRWARWLMMGACFFILALACAYPMIVVVSKPFAKAESPLEAALVCGVFVFVIGALAFQYLSYLRSDLGRLHHSVKRKEESTGVFASAMLWAAAFFLTIAASRIPPVG